MWQVADCCSAYALALLKCGLFWGALCAQIRNTRKQGSIETDDNSTRVRLAAEEGTNVSHRQT